MWAGLALLHFVLARQEPTIHIRRKGRKNPNGEKGTDPRAISGRAVIRRALCRFSPARLEAADWAQFGLEWESARWAVGRMAAVFERKRFDQPPYEDPTKYLYTLVYG